jgi:hypothetical protein
MMADKDKLTTARLIDWLEGRLAAAEADALVDAVQADAALQEQVAWLQDFLQLSRTTVLVDPPAAVHQAARASFAAYAKEKRPLSRLRTLIANLTADNWQRLSLAGVRNVTLATTPRQLIYSSDLADVALNAQASPDGQQIDLHGQLFPLDESIAADFTVHLLQDGLEERLTMTDELGKFNLNGLVAGTYDLLLSGDQAQIAIGPVNLE